MNNDPHWRDLLFFHEFFHGDEGNGLGACHQTGMRLQNTINNIYLKLTNTLHLGWTGLIAKLIHDTGVNCRLPRTPRTPSTAAAHYFDEVFSRYSQPKPFFGRRASSRSIGVRSDLGASEDGTKTPSEFDEDELARQEREREEDDKHVREYVDTKLRRVRSNSIVFDDEDEFEAQLDE